MSRGLRQKEKSRLGEVPRWAPGGLSGGGSDGGEGKPPPPPPGRLWESEQRCRCAAEGGPAWVPKGMNTGKRRRMRMGVRGIGATRSPQVFPMET